MHCNSGCIPRPRALPSWRRIRRRRSSRSTCSRSTASTSCPAAQSERRALLEQHFADIKPPIYLTPMTRDRVVAAQWLSQFEGAGLDGVIAKPVDIPYQPGKRALIKVKHVRTADCVVAGFRWHKSGKDAVGSLLLGLYDDRGVLQHVGVTSSFTMATRKQLAVELAPLRKNAFDNHPWREWAQADGDDDDSHARRPESLECGQGSFVGAAADRTRLRGQVRPSSGKPLSARGFLFAVAARQTAERLPLRPARSHDALTSSRRFSTSRAAGADARGRGGRIVRIERLLARTMLHRYMLKIHPYPGPGRMTGHASHPPAHRRGRDAQPRQDDGLSSARARQAHPLSAARGRFRSADASTRGGGTVARAAVRRAVSCIAVATAHRQGRRARDAPKARAGSASEPGCRSIPSCRSPNRAIACRHRREREVARLAGVDLVPRQGSGYARVRGRPHRIRGGYRPVLRVLVIVDEHAMALFLPPLARCNAGSPPLYLTR